jgi:two-component system sensor histidine kinase TtrS
MHIRLLILLLLFPLLSEGVTGPARAEKQGPNITEFGEKIVRIGVLAFRGPQICLRRWQPTADYLTTRIEDYQFKIIPYAYQELNRAIKEGEIDFVLTNTGHYVMMEARFGISRIATLQTQAKADRSNLFGAVIFTRKDRTDITSLEDLRGKRFMGVTKNGFGGFQMAWRELKSRGIDPFSDFSTLKFSEFPQDNVAYAVRDGQADAGTFRTGMLEYMAAEGRIDLADFKILEPVRYDGFKPMVSTRLYPEWPLTKLKTTDGKLAKKVAIALLSMSENDEAAQLGVYSGWTVPLDYQPVYELFRDLQIGPYAQLGQVSLSKVVQQFGPWIVGAITFLLFVMVWSARTEMLIKKRTNELSLANEELAQQIAERHKAEETARRRQAELARVAEMNSMGELASGIAHELNHPLATITNYATGCIRRLRAGNDNRDEVLDILERVSNQATRASQIIRSLRESMRDDKRRWEQIDLNKTIRDVTDLLEFNLRNSNTQLSLHLAPDLPAILADPIQIEQVLLNLVGNAIDAVEANDNPTRRITITTSLNDQRQIIVTITDSGTGIPEDLRSKLFNPFVTTKKEGMGLGLSISCSIVKEHGGKIWIGESSESGSTFYFSLPTREAA